MWTLTLKGVLARKWRVLLSGFAVVLGVAFVSGTMVLGDTLTRGFNGYVDEAYNSTDVVVQVPAVGQDNTGTIPASLVNQLRRVDGVAAAEGVVSVFARVIPAEGNDVTVSSGSTTSWIADEDLNPLTIVQGRAPTHHGEVVVDPDTATALGVHVGDPVRVVSLRPTTDATLVGLARMGEQDSGLSVTALDVATAQHLLPTPDSYSGVRLKADPGVSPDELRDRVADALAGQAGDQTGGQADGRADGAVPKLLVQTGGEANEDLRDEVGAATTAFTAFLGAFGLITLLVAAFLIVNTFAMMAAQRARELAVLRALGASAAQVRRSVIAEGVVVGVLAGVLGLAGGVGVAALLRTIFEAVGVDLPGGRLVVDPSTIAVGLALGPVVTALAAWLPARRAGRTAPVAAMRGDDARTTGRSTGRIVVTLLAALAAAVLIGSGLAQHSAGIVTGGGVALLVLLLAAGPALVAPSMRVLSWPLRAAGRVPSLLAVENLTRVRRRTAATSAALAVGVALVAGVSVTVASMGAANGANARDMLDPGHVDAVVTSDLDLPFDADTEQQLGHLEHVDGVVGLRTGSADISTGTTGAEQVKQKGASVSGVDPSALGTVLTLQPVDGDVDTLRPGQVLVADDTDLDVGQQVTLRFAGGHRGTVTVTGVYRATNLVSGYLTTTADLDRWTPQRLDGTLLLDLDGSAAALGQVRDALDDAPLLHAQTLDAYADAQVSQADTVVNVITALLGMSLLVAMLGVANTMALSIMERVREVGLLRAVGMSRRQLRRMVRVEAVLTALHGALLGIVLGGVTGIAATAALLHGSGTDIVIPVSRLLVTAAGLTLVAVASAALPARRATRLHVLDALRTT